MALNTLPQRPDLFPTEYLEWLAKYLIDNPKDCQDNFSHIQKIINESKQDLFTSYLCKGWIKSEKENGLSTLLSSNNFEDYLLAFEIILHIKFKNTL